MGESVLGEGDGERAASIFAQIVEMAPDNAAAHGGLIRALLLAGDPESAQTALDAVPADLTDDAAIAQAKSALALAADAPDAGELAAFERSEEHTSELQSLIRISYAVFCLKTKNT